MQRTCRTHTYLTAVQNQSNTYLEIMFKYLCAVQGEKPEMFRTSGGPPEGGPLALISKSQSCRFERGKNTNKTKNKIQTFRCLAIFVLSYIQDQK